MAFTYFFRDYQTIELLVEKLLCYVQGRARINIWDAGCASGQEPFTLAIVLSEKMGRYSFKNVMIHASDIDISDSFREKIENGVYGKEDVERIPRHIFDRYFLQIDEQNFQISSNIRDRVKFFKHDLLSLSPIREDFSMILCKNVLLHFSPQDRAEVVKMYHNSLLLDGLLAMEHTQPIPDETASLFIREFANAQIYRKV
ncbi:MAG: chemotaxis protein CheR [Candidatus Delongbacteria bacterium]|nr:chemotaxis protein CheR [Candidatus Delongbacteria bacterium]MBN2833795.1 chemotaxis protein CheR [Candidatus Delongbacteria bacterium]